MSVRYELYEPRHFEAVKRYSAALWGRRSDAFYEWRFHRMPRHFTMLALDGDTCVAMSSVVAKDYRVRGQIVESLEMFDWSRLPTFKQAGLGSEIVRRLMELGKPVLAFGGTDDTKRRLPKMGWTVLTEARVFALPRSGRWLEDKLASRGPVVARLGGALFEAGGRLVFRAQRARTPASWQVVPLDSFDPAAISLYAEARFHELVVTGDPAVIEWAAHGLQRAGNYLFFDFLDGDRRQAFGIARVVVHGGRRTGVIVDTFAATPSEEIYRRMIGEMATVLVGFGVDAVVTTASCPHVQRALTSLRFIGGHRHALFAFWPPALGAPPTTGPAHIMRGAADDLFLPGPPPIAP